MNENIERNIDNMLLNALDEATVVNKFKQTMTLYNADTRPADILYPRHPSAGNRIDKQSGDAIFFFSTQEEAIKYVVGKGLIKEYIEFCQDINKKIKAIEKSDPEKAKRIRFYISQINKFTEDGKYPPVFRKIGVHMKYFGIDDAKAFPEFPFCRMFIERARSSSRPCYIRICNVPTEDIKHGHCANYKEFTVFKPCKVDKMLTFTLGQLFSKVPVKYFTEFDDFKKFLPTITKNFDKDLFRGLITYQDFRKRLQWSDGKTSHEKLNSIDTNDAKNESCDWELEELFEDVFNEAIKLPKYNTNPVKEKEKRRKKEETIMVAGQSATKAIKDGVIGAVATPILMKGAKKIAKKAGVPMQFPDVTTKQLLKATPAMVGSKVIYDVGKHKFKQGKNNIKEAIKGRRNKKAQEVAVEEGVSLEEALVFVLECEQTLLNEGYDITEIYGIEYISESRRFMLKELSINENLTLEESAILLVMIENDFLNEGYMLEDIYNEKVFSDIKNKYQEFKEKNKDKIEAVKDYSKLAYKGAKDAAKASAMAAGTGYILSQSKLGSKFQNGKHTGAVADALSIGKPNAADYKPKKLATNMAVSAGLSVAGGLISSHLAKKAKEKEEKLKQEKENMNEDILFDLVLECEEELLDEGHSLEEIYGEFDDNDIDNNIEQLSDAVVANYMEWQKGKAGKFINAHFKKQRDKVRAKVKAGKPLNAKEQELWDRMQAIQAKRRATLAAKKNNATK